MPALRLELQEYRGPLVLVWKVHQQPAVLIYAIIVDETTGIALVHVDVVNTVAGQESEVLVLGGGFGTPALTEGVNQRILVGHGALHHPIELVVEVVVETGDAER